MHVFTFGGFSLSSADYMQWGGSVVRGGEGKGWCVESDGTYACRVG